MFFEIIKKYLKGGLAYARKKAELVNCSYQFGKKTKRLFIITDKIPFCPLINGQINKKNVTF